MGVILTTSELTLHQGDIRSLARTSGVAFSTLGLKNRFVKLDHFPNFWVKIKKSMGVSKNRGKTPKWMVKIMEIPMQMDDLGGKPTIFGNTHIETITWGSNILRPPSTHSTDPLTLDPPRLHCVEEPHQHLHQDQWSNRSSNPSFP